MKANTRNTPNNNLKQLKRASTTLMQLTEDEQKCANLLSMKFFEGVFACLELIWTVVIPMGLQNVLENWCVFCFAYKNNQFL